MGTDRPKKDSELIDEDSTSTNATLPKGATGKIQEDAMDVVLDILPPREPDADVVESEDLKPGETEGRAVGGKAMVRHKDMEVKMIWLGSDVVEKLKNRFTKDNTTLKEVETVEGENKKDPSWSENKFWVHLMQGPGLLNWVTNASMAVANTSDAESKLPAKEGEPWEVNLDTGAPWTNSSNGTKGNFGFFFSEGEVEAPAGGETPP